MAKNFSEFPKSQSGIVKKDTQQEAVQNHQPEIHSKSIIKKVSSEDNMEGKREQAEIDDQKRIKEIRAENGFSSLIIEKLEAQLYAEENLGDFENVEIKKISELSCWRKISEFMGNKEIVGIDNVDIVMANGGKQWERVFGSNDSKSAHRPMMIILKKEIFDNENISDEDASWLVHEIGHIKFYQDLGDNLDKYMENYHKRGEYTDTDMEESAFGLQFQYLKSKGKTKNECEGIIKKYLDKSFAEDDKIGEAEKEAKEKEYNQMMKFLDNIY